MIFLTKETESLKGDILEIGSAWGRSLVLFGLVSRKTVWSIDPHTGGRAYIKRGEKQDSYSELISNLKRYNLISKTKVLKNTTEEVRDSNLIPQGVSFSLAFIDGLHTTDGVKTDFDYVFPLMSKGGVIIFDDYFEPSIPDYSDAIYKLISKNSMKLLKEPKCRLVYTKFI